MTSLRFLTCTFWNSYVLKLLLLETLTFCDVTLIDINVVWCYVLSQYRINGTVRPDWSAWEWHLWIRLEKNINRYRFWFLILILNFWKTSKFWAASYKNAYNPPTCWDHGLYGHEPQSFPPNQSPKMRESQQLVFGLRLVRRIFEETLTSRNTNQNSATLGGIFH